MLQVTVGECRSLQFPLCLALAVVFATGCRPSTRESEQKADGGAPHAAAQPATVASPMASPDPAEIPPRVASLETRMALVQQGFDIASMIPKDPHERDRAKAQEWCVVAMIELGDLARAEALAKGIDTWRRPSVYGDIARAYAAKGETENCKRIADRAMALVPGLLDWQQERVRVKVAQAMATLGDRAAAADLERGVGEPEIGKVATVTATTAKSEDFDARAAEIEAWIATGNFDLARNAVAVAVALYQRFGTDDTLRSRAEQLVRSGYAKIPYDLRVAALLDLAKAASGAGRPEDARRLADDAQSILAAAKWLAEDRVAQQAGIARANAAIGAQELARTQLIAALQDFTEHRNGIVDILRARPLRLLALGFAEIGDADKANEVFLLAVDEGAANPNARPRAEDLAATCADLARAGIVPSDALRARIATVQSGLVAPW